MTNKITAKKNQLIAIQDIYETLSFNAENYKGWIKEYTESGNPEYAQEWKDKLEVYEAVFKLLDKMI